MTICHKLASLRTSKFRSKFKLTQKDRDYIATKGLDTIQERAFQFINARVAPDFPKNDGKQTPMRGHPVFFAQHATRWFWDGLDGRLIKKDAELCENLCEKNFPKSAKIG